MSISYKFIKSVYAILALADGFLLVSGTILGLLPEHVLVTPQNLTLIDVLGTLVFVMIVPAVIALKAGLLDNMKRAVAHCPVWARCAAVLSLAMVPVAIGGFHQSTGIEIKRNLELSSPNLREHAWGIVFISALTLAPIIGGACTFGKET